MSNNLKVENLLSLDSLSLGDAIDSNMQIFNHVITSIKTFPDSNYLCTAYLLLEDPEDETNVFFFPLFEDDDKNMQAFLVKTEDETKAFLDYMKKVSENVKVPKLKEFIDEINHEISIDSEKGKYYKSCKGVLTLPE